MTDNQPIPASSNPSVNPDNASPQSTIDQLVTTEPTKTAPAPPSPSPSQPKMNEEIASFDVGSLSGKTRKNKTKAIVGTLVVLLLLVSIPGAVYLVKQRQEIRKEAYPGDTCQYDHDCSGWPDERCSNGQCVPTSSSCGEDGRSCDEVGGESNCCSGVCSYGTCRGNNPGEGCGGFSDIECWTHNNCHFINGSCQPRPPGATPGPGGGTVECSAGPGGVKITNKTNGAISGDVSWFAGRCNDTENCMCGGQSSSENVTLAPNQSWSKGMSGSGCAWQADVSGLANCANSGCDSCESPPPGSPTPTPQVSAQCRAIGMFDTNWTAITNFSALTVGQTVYITTRGSTNDPQGISKARFRINSGAWQETANKHNQDFYIQFTIPAGGTSTIESMVFNPSLGWH